MSVVGHLLDLEVKSEPMSRRDFTIQRWTTDNGLPQNLISALAQTADGYLWLGTWFGVVRFDGLRFTVFNRYNTSALVSDEINALAATPDGALWIATRDGLVRLQDGKWERFTQENGLPTKGFWELAVDAAGTLWIAGDGHRVGRFPNGPFMPVIWPSDAWSPARTLMILPSGEAAIATPNGPAFLPTGTELVLPSFRGTLQRPAGAPPEYSPEPWPAHTMAGDRKGWIVCASSTHVWEISSHESGAISYKSVWGPAENGIVPEILYRQRNGSVWAALRDAGLHRFNQSTFEPIKLLESESQPNVTAFLDDREGSLWLATDAGLFQLRARFVKVFTRADGLPSDETWSVTEGPNKAIWAATKGGPACIGRWRVLPETGIDPWSGTRCILAHPNGTLWMDRWTQVAGLLEHKTDGSERIHFPGESVQALYLDRENRLWVGTDRGMRCLRDGERLELPGLPSAEIRFSLQARDGTMWFGSRREGLFRWRNGHRQQFTSRDGLADDFVVALHEDSGGGLWIATHNGLNRLVPEKKRADFFTFTARHGLLDNLINHILEDDHGFLWFSCNRGVFRMPLAELNAVAEGRKADASCAVFGTADGMVSSETNGERQPAGCKADDGRLWFPTTRGVVVLDPKKLSNNQVAPGVVIERIKADGDVIFGDGYTANTGNITGNTPLAAPTRNPPRGVFALEAGRAHVLEIRYTANTFVAPERIRFKYKLEGNDKDWRDAESSERVALYTNLRPGNHRFRVKACNSHGVWNETGASFAFSLAPKFTQRIWFPTLCGVGLLGASGGFALWRLRWQRRVLLAEQRANLDRERARIARDLHDDLGTALTGLALELDVIRRETRATPDSSNRLSESATRTRDLAERMREVVWAVNPRCDTVLSLAGFLEQQAAQFLQSDGIRGRFKFPEDIPSLPIESDARHQLALAVREALTNVVRHASATEVTMSLDLEGTALTVRIADNGRGFTSGQERRCRDGNGVTNMRERLERVGGSFEMISQERGTTVVFRVPLEKRSESPIEGGEKRT